MMRETRPQEKDESSIALREKNGRIVRLLTEAYGTPAWHSSGHPLDELILTILSQNTSDANSRPAFAKLKERFPVWDDARLADPNEIAAAIRSAGLANIKSHRIKQILEDLTTLGAMDLDFLRDMPVSEARRWLQSLNGIGPKTASCVLLFSLGMPAFPVDTHVFRVSKRLGLVRVSNAEDAHREMESITRPQDIYPLHINLITHGRRVCKAQAPRCAACPLQVECDYFPTVSQP